MLNSVLLWMLALPMGITFLLSDIAEPQSPFSQWIIFKTGISPASLSAVFLLISIGMGLWVLWGTACTLLIGKRIIKSPAGRSRSSFELVRKQAAHLVIPLFLTDILRDIFTVLWMILLIIPGIIYKIRSVLFAVILVCEEKEYRRALRRSQSLIKGHTWRMLWYLVGTSVLLFVPAMLLLIMAMSAAYALDVRLLPAVEVISGAIFSLAMLLFHLATVHMYKALQPS